MPRIRTVLLAFVLAAGIVAGQNTSPAQAGITAFVGVNVLPMDTEKVLQDHTVIVKGDRIVELGPSAQVKPPAGARVIEANGKFLMPGFAEMHGHVPPPGDPFVDNVLFLYLSNGVTTVRGMLGHPGQLELRDQTNAGQVLAPTLYLAGPSFSGQSIDSPEQAVQKVREQKAAGWDLLKVHPGPTREEYDAMAKTAREAGIAFAGHVPKDVGILHALEMGQQTIDHLDGYLEHLEGHAGTVPEERLRDMAARTKAAGAWVVPTMALWETILGAPPLERLQVYPELKYLPRKTVEMWTSSYQKRLAAPTYDREVAQRVAENRIRLLRVFSGAGVPILFGTDAPQFFSVPGFSIHREIPKMRQAGMTPYEILRSGTKAVGEYFKDKDKFGLVAPGHRADLILLDANPLADVANLQKRAGVMARGRWLSEKEIQERLAKIERDAQGK